MFTFFVTIRAKRRLLYMRVHRRVCLCHVPRESLLLWMFRCLRRNAFWQFTAQKNSLRLGKRRQCSAAYLKSEGWGRHVQRDQLILVQIECTSDSFEIFWHGNFRVGLSKRIIGCCLFPPWHEGAAVSFSHRGFCSWTCSPYALKLA